MPAKIDINAPARATGQRANWILNRGAQQSGKPSVTAARILFAPTVMKTVHEMPAQQRSYLLTAPEACSAFRIEK